jgi:hypothetical protein
VPRRVTEVFGVECLCYPLAAAVLLIAPVLWAGPAKATLISIGLQEDGGALSTVSTDLGTGNAFFSGLFGTYVVNNVSGTGSPLLPQPQLLTNSTNVTAGSGNHVLNVFITEQGLSSPTGIAQFLSRFSSTLITGAVTSVVETTFLSTSNALYGGSQLSTATFTAAGPTILGPARLRPRGVISGRTNSSLPRIQLIASSSLGRLHSLRRVTGRL